MAEDDIFSPAGADLSSSQDLDFAIEAVSSQGDQVRDLEVSGAHLARLNESTELLVHRLDPGNVSSDGRKEFIPPAVGMEFETYDDAYNYYMCYAQEFGFRIRVKNSWFKRNSKEKYGAVLCCSSQGFKRTKDVNRLRKETRTGCPAMIRMRLVDSERWRVLEATLDHNHLLGAKLFIKSAMRIDDGVKRKLKADSDSELRKITLYRAVVINTGGDRAQSPSMNEIKCPSKRSNQAQLKKGDSQAIYNYLCRMQLTVPNFFYSIDFSEEGCLKNVFWIDARSRSAACYFGDVLLFDNSYLVSRYEVPLVAFVGVNHHGQSVLLGCGLLSGETTESYTWLFKMWLKCNSGCSPQTIITDRSKILQSVISEVLPTTHHRFSISYIMSKVPEKLGGLHNYEAIRKALHAAVYGTLKVMEFEAAWKHMLQQFSVANHEWLKSLFEDRNRWAPVYLREIFFAGMSTSRPGEILSPFFVKYIHKQTPLKEFLDKYELALHRKDKEEIASDIDSRTSTPGLKTRCPFERQLSKVYSREIFHRFQVEVEEMYSCFSTTQLQIDGPTVIFLVKERVLGEGNCREIKNFEVLFNRASSEVRCICSCFNFNGFLCRHALCVLNFNEVEEVPSKYVLSRWKKDYKRLHVMDNVASTSADGYEKVVWFNQLYHSALQVVEEGAISLNHYNIALKAFEESLSRVRGVEGTSAYE